MAIVLDGTLAIDRDEDGEICNIIWFLYGLPQAIGEPFGAVFLEEAFGEGSPQMVGFELDGEEYIVYADWEAASEPVLSGEVSEFYREYGHLLISAVIEDPESDQGVTYREWLMPVECFDNYMELAKKMA
ncbi:hypothetical protein DET50_12439 [Marinobacter pelagius]|uniref:Uncharacterized protein n=1 Tax=Marinobacter pelagius TaxID=379482 RepID=A0A366GFB5_9GAMM|nr:hypothetical protein [Marinobacter pelagius]RBP25046.1 hypothetical protein DET50_12439 [Marinobacter pelagius]